MHADAPSPTWGKAGMGANKKVCLVMKQVEKNKDYPIFQAGIHSPPFQGGVFPRLREGGGLSYTTTPSLTCGQ